MTNIPATMRGIAAIRTGQMTLSTQGGRLAKRPPNFSSPANKKITGFEQKTSDWLEKESKLIRNKAGDPAFISKDSSRRVRFDFNNPSPHNNLHSHVEIKINGKWVKSGPIYPKDVPRN